MVVAKLARRAACVALAGCVVAGMGAVSGSAAARVRAEPAAAASHLALQFYDLDGKTSVVSSRHHHLVLTLHAENSRRGVAADRPRATSGRSVQLSIDLASHDNSQSDTWAFSLPGAALTANPTKATGRLATGSRITPYGAIRLAITPVGKLHTQMMCSEQRQTSRAVQLRGQFLFSTGPAAAHGLGTVGTRKHRFTLRAVLNAEFSKPTDDPSCFGPTRQPCPAAVTAQYYGPVEPDGTSVSFAASPHGASALLEGSRDVTLRKPKGAQRIDEVVTKAVQPTVAPEQTGTSVTITADGPGAAGSVTLNAFGAPTSYTPDYCAHPSTEAFYNATVAATPTLRFHSRLAGGFAVPNDSATAVYFTYQRD